MRSATTNTSASNAVATGLKPVVRITIYWNGVRFYSNVSGDSYLPQVISFGGINYNVARNTSNVVSRATFTLDDSDGTIKSILDTSGIVNARVRIEVYYNGLSGTTGNEYFDGIIIDPLEYSEGERTITVNAESLIQSSQVGFSTQEGQFGVNNDVAIGKFWPIVFGTPAHVPAVLVQREPHSELKYQFTMGDLKGPFFGLFEGSDGYDKLSIKDQRKVFSIIMDAASAVEIPNTIYVHDGSGFTQDEIIDINVKGVIFRGKMSGSQFTIEEANVAKYVDVLFDDRDAADTDFNNPNVAWLADSTQSLENAYCWFKGEGNPSIQFSYKSQVGPKEYQPIILKCVRQNGAKIWLENPLKKRKFSKLQEDSDNYVMLDSNSKISEVRGLNLSGMRINLTDAFEFLAGLQSRKSRRRDDTVNKPYGQLIQHLEQAKYIRDIFFSAEPGDVVRQWDELADIYVANALPSNSVSGVWGVRSVDGEDRFIPIPQSYYTINLSKSTSALAQSLGAPALVTTIEFDQPLSTYKDQGWKDEIYVTMESSLSNNTSTQIEWILDNYTSLNTDGSFSTVATILNNKPSHFALLQTKDSIQLANEMAWQCGCGLVYDGQDVTITVVQTEPSASDTLAEADTLFKSIKRMTTPSTQVITALVGKYNVSYQPHLERDERGPEREYTYTNNTNVYGYRKQDYDFYIYNNQDAVANTLNFWGYRISNVWKMFELTTFHDKQLLEPFDKVSCSYTDFGSFNGIIHGYNFDPATGLINLTLWTPYTAGNASENASAWQSVLSSTPTNPASAIEEYDYDIRLPANQKDFERWEERMKLLRGRTKRTGIVTAVNVDGFSDQITVEIHEDGEQPPDSDETPIEPTVGDAAAYIPDPDYDPVIGEAVQLVEDDSGMLYAVNPATPSRLRVKVVTEYHDFLYCKVSDKVDSEGADVYVYVAKPWDLRKKPFDGVTYNIEDVDYEYTYDDTIGERTSTDEDDGEEIQRITPPYYVDTEIIAERLGVGLVNLNPDEITDPKMKPVVWQDTNMSNRQWAEYSG